MVRAPEAQKYKDSTKGQAVDLWLTGLSQLPWEPQLLTDNAEALGLWSPHPPASFSCQGLDQSPGRVACDLWPHKQSPQGQSQPLFTSLNFIYRANEGSPTPKAGQASLKTEAAHPLPPCQPLLNPKASVEGPLPVAVILPVPGRSGFLAGFRLGCPSMPQECRGRKEKQMCIVFRLCNRNCANCFYTPCRLFTPSKNFAR